MKPITLKQARRVLEIVDHGLISGLGKPKPGQMCVEAAVCFALDLPHSDNPQCVDPVVRKFKIAINDCNWSSPAARAAGLRQIAVAQLGSRDRLDVTKFVTVLAEQTIRKVLPPILRAIGLEKEARRCEEEGTSAAAATAATAANAANAAAAANAAGYAATAAGYAATAAATAATAGYATAAAGYAAAAIAGYATAAAGYAATAAAATAGYAAASDEILCLSVKVGIEALRAASSPGIKMMDKLCPI